MKVTPSGIRITSQYLSIGVRVGEGPVARFAEVKVPIQSLVDAGVQDVIHTFITNQLKAVWRTANADDPLPLEHWE